MRFLSVTLLDTFMSTVQPFPAGQSTPWTLIKVTVVGLDLGVVTFSLQTTPKRKKSSGSASFRDGNKAPSAFYQRPNCDLQF